MGNILDDLKVSVDIKESDTSQDKLLSLFLNQSIDILVNYIYPYEYTDADKNSAIGKYTSTIVRIATYLYFKQGAEGEIMHTENGVTRLYSKQDIPSSYFVNIPRYASVF